MPYKEIAKNLGDYSASQIAGWISGNGYGNNKHRKTTIFSESDKRYMSDNYMTLSYKQIAKKIGFTERQVRSWINNNLDSKLRSFNKSYFSDISTPTKAYWLGFIYADGYIINNPKNRNYELGMELQSEDKYMLDMLNEELGNVHRLYHKHQTKQICGYEQMSVTDSWVLRVYSKDIVNDLIRHHIVPNKTNSELFPKVNKFFLDFVRGYLDGDGCIYVDKKGHLYVHITSANVGILNYLQEKFLSDYKVKSHIYNENSKKYRIVFYGAEALNMLNLIYYNDSVIKLNRKYDKYSQYLGSLLSKDKSNKVGKIGECA